MPPDPDNPGSIQSRRPYPYVGDVYQISSIAYGNYNWLLGELERRFTNGLSLAANYVWSKSMDALNNGAEDPQYGPDVQAEYGQSDFNPGQVFKLSGVYEFPSGKVKSSGSANWLANAVVGGWQGSGILTETSRRTSVQCQRHRSLRYGGGPCAAEKPGLQRETGRLTSRLLSGSTRLAMCKRESASLVTSKGIILSGREPRTLICLSSRRLLFERTSRCSSGRTSLIR